MHSQKSTHRSGNGRPTWGLRPVAAACALVAAAGGVHAQQAAAPAAAASAATVKETIVVTGLRRAIESSIATKRTSVAP